MSIVEIAKRTGISKSTVSRALNNGSVSGKKRHLIEQTIKDMGYQIPKVRRGPKSKKRDKPAIGILFLADDLRLLQSPDSIYSLIFNHLLETGIKEDLEISPHFLPVSAFTEETAKKFSAFIVIGPPWADGTLSDSLKKSLKRLPLVYIQDGLIAARQQNFLEDADRVFYENQLVGCLAGRYFSDKGYKRVAILNPYYRHPLHDTRMSSLINVLHKSKIKMDIYARQTPYERDISYLDVDEMVSCMLKKDSLPEGLFVTTDIRTVHAYNALLARGIKPMEDIDIISCDNIAFFTDQMNPKPAEIDIGLDRIARCALDLLQQLVIKGKDEPKTVLIRPKLII